MDNLTVRIKMLDGGLELLYDEVKDFSVKSLEECLKDGVPVAEDEIEFFGANDKFFVFHSESYTGVFPVALCSAYIS